MRNHSGRQYPKSQTITKWEIDGASDGEGEDSVRHLQRGDDPFHAAADYDELRLAHRLNDAASGDEIVHPRRPREAGRSDRYGPGRG